MADMLLMRSSMGSDGDERVAAKAGLEAAEEQLQSLCASHAGTFVAVERRGRALEVALQELLEKVQSVESQVSSTQEALEQEEDGSENTLAALSEKHRVRRRTLLQHSSLLELLELPSLMDACVRSSLYEEALSIAAFANTLERRHTEKNEVVMKVIAQVRSRQSDLRRYLLHSLKSQVTMPECLEIVTALRRLNSIDLERLQSEKSNLERVHAAMEFSLQVDFLESRDVWLDQPSSANVAGFLSPTGSASNISATSSRGSTAKMQLHSSEQLLDTIERYRTRYDILVKITATRFSSASPYPANLFSPFVPLFVICIQNV
jgi:conserved oligomeric Golgi complex subunit 8